ncbi:MAG: hypothetical protein AAGA77_09840 [Bacteroidota bacterium]
MRIFFTICTLLLFSCSKTSDKLPSGLQYFPTIDLLENGLVFKYYQHQGKIGTPLKTNINYQKVRLTVDTLIYEEFDAAFQRKNTTKMLIDQNKWITLEEATFDHRFVEDVLVKKYPYEIVANVHTDWINDTAFLEKVVVFEGSGSRIKNIQTGSKDSITGNGKCKVHLGERIFYSIQDDEEKEASRFSIERRYEEGLGLVQSILSNDEYIYDSQLDEIMSVAEFERRSNHGTQRVAYIDTLMTIDDHTEFQPCFLPQKINDYYNDRRAGFKGGKGRLRAILKDKLDPSKLQGQSGYLTFRFVVNCEGEAGWFVTEEAGLDYIKKKFSQECRMHLYEILKAEKEWIHLEIRKQPRDAYVYITFKLEDGEIIEILP